jgi:hypothetical protein
MPQTPQKTSNWSSFFKRLLAAIITIALFVGVIYLALKARNTYTINLSRPAVIRQIRSLARLETAQFTIEKVIDASSSETNALQRFLFGDKILLIAHGQVIAGFDLSQMSQSDIEISGRAITMNLPPPQILVATLDNSKTRVYDRQQGILNRADIELESEARQQAERAVRQAACDGEILNIASQNAKRQLTSFLEGFGFTTVTINTPTGRCE